MNDCLPCVEVNPVQAASASVIWLHGLGADGHDFEAIVPQLQIAAPVRYIFPHAPQRPVTINNGYVMRAWYDILAFDLSRSEDSVGVLESEQQLQALIEREEARGIASQDIVLAGFSQGGAIALHAGLRFPRPLAGIVALSTYLPLAAQAREQAHAANRNTPIFMAHGREDTVVTLPHALISRQALEAMGRKVEWHEYAMAHSICNPEVDDIRSFLARVLGGHEGR